ncbi:type 1 phosphatases regulator ypi1-like [Cyclospora cayetanensis]|uniref:Type 1 phosphatases regulator ypi1-like n=1 Tax=Cyclospora cayetanensis TaxID=88456 RepID=A0A6P6RVB8_9EIME|nr:type 1 phosphatases regulator ypi1-like [Cyclospora cayetanensis]
MASTTRTETVTQAVIHLVSSAAPPATSEQQNASIEQQKQVSFEEGTVDNENLGRKSSKVCCIYHKPRAFAESSSESDSSSDGDITEGAQKAGKVRRLRKSKVEKESGSGQRNCCHGSSDMKQAQVNAKD